jgi:methyl-accepting chemotaxis protein/type II secretory pathway pseudopilin PulG
MLNNLTIAAKLNLVLLLAIAVVFGLAGIVISNSLGKSAEVRWTQNLQQVTQQAINMTEAYSSSLEKYAETVGITFAEQFIGNVRLDSSNLISSGSNNIPALMYEGVPINNNFRQVDKFTASTGAVATIFIRKGNDFIRASTSLRKENGERAIGTALDQQHPAYKTVLTGSNYTGRGILFGNDYMTHYEPLKDAVGNIVGAVFTGINFSEGMKSLKQKILAVKIGATGYIYVVSTAGNNSGVAIIHPSMEGKDLDDIKDASGNSIIKAMIDKKEGVFEYSYSDATGKSKTNLGFVKTFAPWNWMIVSVLDKSDIASETGTVNILLMVTGLLVVIALAVCVFISTRNWVSLPLRQAVNVIHNVAAGKLDVHIEHQGQDEIGKLFDATTEMCANLRSMLSNINTNIDTLSGEANELSEASSQSTRIAGDQNAAATAMAASLQQIAISTEQVSSHASETREVVGRFGTISDNGVKTVGLTIGSINEIATTVQNVSESLAALEAQSEQISSIVSVIQGVANQTNLLALNAAIEAARAGETGRGFAVVADEVRKLAERTANSTQEISTTVQAIQERSRDTVAQMRGGLQKVESGVNLANEAGNSIAEIRQNTSHVEESIAAIALAIGEQSSSNQEVVSSVGKIAEQAKLNHHQAESTSLTAGKLKTMAAQLRESVSRFQF